MKNRVELEGFVIQEPNVRKSSTGRGEWAEFILSVPREWTTEDGRTISNTDDIRIKCFSDVLPQARKYAKKDCRISVTGNVQTNPWTNPDTGKKSIFLNIVAKEIKALI